MTSDTNFKPLATQYLGSTLGTGYFSASEDAILVQYKENGILVRAKEIAFSATGITMPNQAMFRFGDYFVFGGHST